MSVFKILLSFLSRPVRVRDRVRVRVSLFGRCSVSLFGKCSHFLFDEILIFPRLISGKPKACTSGSRNLILMTTSRDSTHYGLRYVVYRSVSNLIQ